MRIISSLCLRLFRFGLKRTRSSLIWVSIGLRTPQGLMIWVSKPLGIWVSKLFRTWVSKGPRTCISRRSQDLSVQRLLWRSPSLSSGQFMSMRGPRIINPWRKKAVYLYQNQMCQKIVYKKIAIILTSLSASPVEDESVSIVLLTCEQTLKFSYKDSKGSEFEMWLNTNILIIKNCFLNVFLV